MRTLVILTVLIMISACSTSELISKRKLERKNYQEVIGVIVEGEDEPDVGALYPNGLRGIYEHLAQNIKYPSIAKDNFTQGRVLVEYVVEKDGRVNEVRVVESVSPEIDEEAIRVISTLKRFYPAFKNGKPLRILYRQPIKFSLE